MGSVKDLRVVEQPTEDQLGRGYFIFSDRYSIFDWGEMPDHIPEKGKTLAMMGAFNFELLEKKGIPTHYQGMLEDGSEEGKKMDELTNPSHKMLVVLTRKPNLEMKNGEYQYEDLGQKSNYLIPLEVIFRNSIPIGSSLRRRYSPDELGLDISKWPDRTIELEEPIIDFSTKLEEQDRYIDEKKAKELSGLTDEEFKRLKEYARKINSVLNQHAQEKGLKHLDGKVEFAYYQGKIMLVDVSGTFDEDRFSFQSTQISKETIRQWYKKNDSSWYKEVKQAKKKAEEEGIKNWKLLVEEDPVNLDLELLKLVENLYKAGANRWLGKQLFEAPDLEEVVKKIGDENE